MKLISPFLWDKTRRLQYNYASVVRIIGIFIAEKRVTMDENDCDLI